MASGGPRWRWLQQLRMVVPGRPRRRRSSKPKICTHLIGVTAFSALRGPLVAADRPHRALHLRPPRPDAPVPKPIKGRIRRRPVLGGLINQYEAAA